MPNKFSAGTCCVVALALGLAVAATPAYAGFEWVAPDAAATQSAPNNGYPLSGGATKRPEVISPVIISGDNQPSMQPAPTPSYGAPTFSPDVGMQPAPMPPSDVMGSQSMATAKLNIPASSNDIVQGFASQVPLALALRQILPVGYNFSIDQTIDMDTTVSYKGGKSWRDTVKEMLVPLNLAAREQGTTLIIAHIGSPSVAAAAPRALPALSPSVVSDNSTSSLGRPLVASSSMRSGELPSVSVNPPDGWTAERGETLRKVLMDWCRRSGVELQWLAEYDYPMEASAHFNGGFEDAVRLLLAGFENARPQPVAELHTNSAAGQMLLVVQARGNNYTN
jgi:hypothetical protein